MVVTNLSVCQNKKTNPPTPTKKTHNTCRPPPTPTVAAVAGNPKWDGRAAHRTRGAALDGMVAAVCRWNDVQLCLSLSFLSRSFLFRIFEKKRKTVDVHVHYTAAVRRAHGKQRTSTAWQRRARCTTVEGQSDGVCIASFSLLLLPNDEEKEKKLERREED